jgi:hypothetical protein
MKLSNRKWQWNGGRFIYRISGATLMEIKGDIAWYSRANACAGHKKTGRRLCTRGRLSLSRRI